MNNVKWIVGAMLVAVVAKPQAAFCADDLGQRRAFDVAWTVAGEWEAGATLAVSVRDGVLELVNRGEPSPAAPLARAPFDPDTTITLRLRTLEKGQLTVQVEWFDESGRFLFAADAVDRITAGGVTCRLRAEEWRPPTGPKPAALRVKLWLGGAGARAEIDELTITAPRRWRAGKVTLIGKLDAATALTPDEGMIAAARDGVIGMRLAQGKQRYAGLVLDPLLAYAPAGVVMLDLASLRGGSVGLQAVCFDQADTYLASVDLMTGLDHAGVFEVPLNLFASAFPAGTAQVRFKLWLAGEQPEARVAGVFYGAVQP